MPALAQCLGDLIGHGLMGGIVLFDEVGEDRDLHSGCISLLPVEAIVQSRCQAHGLVCSPISEKAGNRLTRSRTPAKLSRSSVWPLLCSGLAGYPHGYTARFFHALAV